jgi:hypothetical protein
MMNLTNWTTRFRAGNARNCERQPDGQGRESDSADAQVASAQLAASHSLVDRRVGTYLIGKRLADLVENRGQPGAAKRAAVTEFLRGRSKGATRGRTAAQVPWLAGAGALGVVALGLGALLWPPTLKPTVPQASVRKETAQNQTPTVDAVKPRTLAIVRLPSDGPVASAGGAAEAGAAGSAAPHRFNPGERIRLRVAPSRDAHVYCYLQDESRRIVRFYPNRFNTSALVRADAPIEIPGAMRFELVANSLDMPETIACFASERDVAGSLPPSVFGDNFSELPAASLDEVRQAFARAAADGLAEGRFQIRFK